MWENMPFKSYIVNSYSIIQMKHIILNLEDVEINDIKGRYWKEEAKS